MAEVSAGHQRTAREVMAATRPMAEDDPAKSWWYVATTLTIMTGLLGIAAVAPWWPVRLVASVFGALVMVRMFILYHDYMHGSILRRSLLARVILLSYGYLVLVPARSWRFSHNFHHAHPGIPSDASAGSFPMLTTDMWREASWLKRARYRFSRHPIIILCAYITVFAYSLTIEAFLENPRKNWDSLLALAMHGALLSGVWWFGGFEMAFFAVILPMIVASMIGAYLFYVQHNFVGMRIVPGEEWSNYQASLDSCSFLRVGPIMRWFTGDIGYHHVHHLNAAIPFYRLEETMAAVPELQHPVETSLTLKDILACLRLKLWDTRSGKMLTYAQARQLAT